MKQKARLYIDASPISEERISGIGHMTLELIRALEKHPDHNVNFEIWLVIAYDKLNNLKKWGFMSVRYKKIYLPMRILNILWKFDLLPPMDLLLGKGTYWFPNYKNWRLTHSPSVTTVCDISYQLYPEWVSPKNQLFLAKNIHKWISRTSKVITISANARQEIIDNLKVKADKTVLVACGVDLAKFAPVSTQDKVNYKKKIGIEKEYLLYLGNIEPRKNINRLIEAYKQLPETIRQNYTLLLVGGGGWLNEPILEAIATAQQQGFDVQRPSFYVPDEELPLLVGAARLLVHPALYEGFGITPLQAMASGVPVTASNNSSLPEVIGDAGLLFDAEDSEDIAQKITMLLTDAKLASKLVKKGRNRVEQFSWEKSADIMVRTMEAINV